MYRKRPTLRNSKISAPAFALTLPAELTVSDPEALPSVAALGLDRRSCRR